jgi:hypothetical protein
MPDTVVGFTEGADYLRFAGQTTSSVASVVASAQTVNGNTVLTFADNTSVILAGINHADSGFFV